MDSSSKRVDGGLALHNVVRCLGSPVTPPEQIADYIRLIAVAFPLTSARRSSAYAGQLIADCCGDFPSLAAIPPAFVFGGGLSRDLALRRPGHRRESTVANAAIGPAGRGRRP